MVSVIIPTYNEEEVIERLLRSLKDQSYSEIEIIVVDNNSTDKTKKIAYSYTNNVYDFGPERSAQRNFGAKMAKGKYFLFLDADMELTPNVIQECVSVAESDKKIGAIVIPEKSIATNFWENVKAFERTFYNLEGDLLTDAARFFTKEAFNKAKGYDESITGPEDWDLPERVRKLCFIQKRIKSKIYHHERIKSPFTIAKKKFYYALRSHRYLKKHNLPVFGPKTIYFLRPVFYRNWKALIKHPILTLGMFLMFTLELVYGGFGFLVGKFTNK